MLENLSGNVYDVHPWSYSNKIIIKFFSRKKVIIDVVFNFTDDNFPFDTFNLHLDFLQHWKKPPLINTSYTAP